MTGLLAWAVVSAAAQAAQVFHQPEPRPIVTADSDEWFRLGDAITFEGDFYYPAGPRVFFDGNVMVRTGFYRGVPLYADATLEPYSKVFVPVSGGLMQPYERRRAGELAGTTGSQAPSFPVAVAGEPAGEPAGARRMAPEAVGTAGRAAMRLPSAPAPAGVVVPPRDVIEVGEKPKGLNEIYVMYAGYRWKAAGMAVPLKEGQHIVIGEYRGYPVYADRDLGKDPRRIYLPSRAGYIAPYERVAVSTPRAPTHANTMRSPLRAIRG
ncbi:MAG: hypothetical protein HYU53_06460 [Acidobacteria bacterium]|nr:hypothetical protein [Acidobacteriota bacterium]